MDIRTRGEVSSAEEIAKQEVTKLNDSLIFNIIKKIEVKIAMQQKYDQQRTPIIKMIPNNLAKYIYSDIGLGYLIFTMLGIAYLRYKHRRPVTLNSIFPHLLIAFTINQYDRYRGIMNVDQQMKNQYKSYQYNTKSIIQEKKRRFSLLEYVKEGRYITYDKLLEMMRYKPLY